MSITVCRVFLALSLVVPASTAFAQEVHDDSVLLAAVAPLSGAGFQSASSSPAAQASAAQSATRTPKVKGFSIVLLVGEVQGRDNAVGGPSGEIPAAVQKALSSVQAFLPYKTYRLYDAALLPTPLGFTSTSALMRNPVSALRTRVQITNATLPTPAPKPITVSVSLIELLPDAGTTTKPSANTLIFANISLDVGETVVVGTSQVGRDTGLLALLTAIPE